MLLWVFLFFIFCSFQEIRERTNTKLNTLHNKLGRKNASGDVGCVDERIEI